MVHKNKLKTLFLLLISVIFVFVLASCGGGTNTGSTPKTPGKSTGNETPVEPPVDTFHLDGFNPVTEFTNALVFQDIFSSVGNSVAATNGNVMGNAAFAFDFDVKTKTFEYTAHLETYYNKTNAAYNRTCLTLTEKESSEAFFTLYIFTFAEREDGKYDGRVYLEKGETQVYFDLVFASINPFLPLDLTEYNSMTEKDGIIDKFISGVYGNDTFGKALSNVRCEYNPTTKQKHYYLDLSLSDCLKGIRSYLVSQQNAAGISNDVRVQMQDFLKLFDYTVKTLLLKQNTSNITDAKIPAMNLSVELMLENTPNAGDYSSSKMGTANILFKVNTASLDDTVFNKLGYTATMNLKELKTANSNDLISSGTLSVGVPLHANFDSSGYINFLSGDDTYQMKAKLMFENSNDIYDFDMRVRYGTSLTDTEFAVYVINAKGEYVSATYYTGAHLYFNYIDGANKVQQIDFTLDLEKLKDSLPDLMSPESHDEMLRGLIYILGAITVDSATKQTYTYNFDNLFGSFFYFGKTSSPNTTYSLLLKSLKEDAGSTNIESKLEGKNFSAFLAKQFTIIFDEDFSVGAFDGSDILLGTPTEIPASLPNE
ncbi:MAG: hypothetical protein LBN25_00305 [Christensenellaceae bacterium]|jgi:hypothetical protein|nr:hypothetical protein [Christensenellaceae bacterium]